MSILLKAYESYLYSKYEDEIKNFKHHACIEMDKEINRASSLILDILTGNSSGDIKRANEMYSRKLEMKKKLIHNTLTINFTSKDMPANIYLMYRELIDTITKGESHVKYNGGFGYL